MYKHVRDLAIDEEFYFQWHITERCNWKCKHCYQTGKPTPELPLQDLLKIASIMEEATTKWGKIASLSLTGGEPFLRHDELYTLADFFDHSDRFDYYDILTNGSFITETEASYLASRPKLRRVQVSLEGASAMSNDDIRGKGTFKKTLQAIRILRSKDIEISVMMTLTRKNKDEIEPLIRLLGNEGVAALSLERFVPEGNGSGIRDALLSREEIKDLYQKIYGFASNGSPIRLLLHRPLFSLIAPEDSTVGALCSAGNNALTIMPDGAVYPCRRLPIPIGNILNDGIYRIWYGAPLLWELRNPENYKGKCRTCDLFVQCRGCRAIAFSVTGDYLAEDPQCWI
jgi:radical SAM protein with 4Fe4S-binding SPASM domain